MLLKGLDGLGVVSEVLLEANEQDREIFTEVLDLGDPTVVNV